MMRNLVRTQRAHRRSAWLPAAVAAGAITAALLAAAPANASADRGYELVSHPASVGATLAGVLTMTPDGNRALFQSEAKPMDEADLAGGFNIYGAERTPQGWRQWSLAPAQPGTQEGFLKGGWEGWSADFENVIWTDPRSLTPDVTYDPSRWYVFQVARSGKPVTRLFGPFEQGMAYLDGSPDLRQHLIRAFESLSPEDVGRPPSTNMLYVQEDGEYRMVGKSPDGGPTICNADFYPSASLLDLHSTTPDFSRVFFRGTECTTNIGRVLVYEDGGTELIAESRCTRVDCGPERSAEYVTASPNGTKVLVSTPQQLTNDDTDSTVDLYLHDRSADPDQLLRISAPTTGTAAARVVGFLGAADNLSRLYFVARGVLTDEPNSSGAHPVNNQPNLYAWEDGDLAYIATLNNDDSETWALDRLDRQADVTPDGGKLLFQSVVALTDDDTDTVADVFLYDSAHGDLTRVSVGANGTGNGAFPAVLPPASGAKDSMRHRRRALLSVDGGTAFFETSEALTSADRNATPDVYEYRDGQTRLVTSGRVGAAFVRWNGATWDGESVFFTTTEALVPEDIDGGMVDIYVARRGGGFPPTPAPAPCAGDLCQGTQANAPELAPVGSRWLSGRASPPSRSTRLRVTRRALRGSRLVLRVAAPAAGRLTVAGRAVRRTRKRVGRSGVHRVRVPLRPATRRALARGRTTRTAVRVGFRPRSGGAPTRLRLTLRLKGSVRR